MKTTVLQILYTMLMIALASCGATDRGERIPPDSPFDEDVEFLKKYSEVMVLTEPSGKSRIAVMPGLQARVMTSTAGPPQNLSYGWINRAFFEAGDTSIHMNAFGGEERIWLGPEGGQFSIFFDKDSAFTFDNWHTPRLIDLEAYDLIEQTAHSATFEKSATLRNYSGTVFHLRIQRGIRVLGADEALKKLGLTPAKDVALVSYETLNRLENRGQSAWRKESGLLSIWLLGMFNPSPGLTMVIPYVKGPASSLGPVVNDDYFGKVPEDRLKVADSVIYFKGDGKYRSKIGLSPERARNIMGSYDPSGNTLTIVTFTKGAPGDVYVNSKWEMQDEPFKGDVVNAYNDGPPAPGAKPMGPFYELESSSPARELQPGEHIEHIQTTYHFHGEESALEPIAKALLGVSIGEIKAAFP